MSKIEQALEKAKKLRETTNEVKRVDRLEVFKRIEPTKVDNHFIVTITQPDSPIAEEYRRLKSMLLRETKTDFKNTIMITSSIDGEGKTLTAINLAMTLAQEIDHSILLIDADLRKPRTHEYLGIDYKYGLSDYLVDNVDISEVLIKTGIGNLVLLPAGRSVENPVEILSSEKMKALVQELKQRYMDRYVIIDTPPILPFADAISIGSYVDGIVFVVKEGRTQKQSIENAMHLIKNLNVLGVVFNNVNELSLDGGSYHYGYYRYKNNGKNNKKEK